jgi:predicted lipid-binding transport protein (Tim44 family)
MADNLSGSATPQFGTAEYKSSGGPDRCKSCDTTLTNRYYRINGTLACENCADRLKQQVPKDTHQAFVRGIFFGLGGALLGLILYAAFGILTGLVIGYVSLAVGYIVGRAIKMGSGGMGGRRYQVTAALLTYSAVSIAAIPIYISQVVKDKKAEKERLVQHTLPQASAPAPGQAPADNASAVPQKPRLQSPAEPKKPSMGFGVAVGLAVLIGLASPFLELQDPFHGIIGLIILFVGIRIAWRLTAGVKLDILGPFDKNAPAPAPPPIAG